MVKGWNFNGVNLWGTSINTKMMSLLTLINFQISFLNPNIFIIYPFSFTEKSILESLLDTKEVINTNLPKWHMMAHNDFNISFLKPFDKNLISDHQFDFTFMLGRMSYCLLYLISCLGLCPTVMFEFMSHCLIWAYIPPSCLSLCPTIIRIYIPLSCSGLHPTVSFRLITHCLIQAYVSLSYSGLYPIVLCRFKFHGHLGLCPIVLFGLMSHRFFNLTFLFNLMSHHLFDLTFLFSIKSHHLFDLTFLFEFISY